MRDIHELLREKEMDCARVQREIEALQLVISLLEQQPPPDREARKQPERENPSVAAVDSTGTEGPRFTSLGQTESSFWKRRR